MLIALPAFHISYLLANDTLNTVLITEGDRGLALEKLMQFKCNESWTPQINECVFDQDGNVYTTIEYGEKIELYNGEKKKTSILIQKIIMKN